MALTSNNFIGFETGGLEEAGSTSGSPDATEATVVRSGIRALKLPGGSSNRYRYNIDDGIASAGNDHIIGFAFQFSANPTVRSKIFTGINAGGGSPPIAISLDTDRKLVVEDRNSFGRITSNTALTAGTYNFVELYWQNLDSGNAELFINNISEGTTSARDFLDAVGVVNRYELLSNSTASEPDHFFDDAYVLTGATAASDRLGDAEVFMYQKTVEDATDQGDALADGTWALVSETPLNEGAANDAQYVDTGNLTGSTICDEGTRSGPSGDANVDGDSNIKAAKFIGRFKRGTGGGRVHSFLHGNSGDGVTASADMGLSTAYATKIIVSEAASIVPLSTESFQHGFSKSATAGQDIFCGDIWAMLLHVPTAAGGADFFQSVEVSSTVTVSFARSPQILIAPIVTATTTISKLLDLRKTITIAVTGAAATARLRFISLAYTVTGSVTRTAVSLFTQAVSATVTATATLSALTMNVRAIAVTVTGTVTSAILSTFTRAISATVTGTASLLQTSSRLRAIAVTVTGAASLRKTVGRLITRTVTGAVTLVTSIISLITQVVSVTVTAVATVVSIATFTRVVSVAVTATVSLVRLARKAYSYTVTAATTLATVITLAIGKSRIAGMIKGIGKMMGP